MPESLELDNIYEKRFDDRGVERKNRIWQVLCRHFFQKYVQSSDTVLDLGAGQCEFINNIRCAQRIAVDLNPDVHEYAGKDVQIYITSITDLNEIDKESVNVVFASNIFEHLPDKASLIDSLKEVERVLQKGGRLLILQPNISLLGGQYWDFIDHLLPLTDRALVEALRLTNLETVEVRRRFLPYTTLGKIPQHPFLVRLYLRLPFLHWILGKQSWVVGRKP